MDNRIIISECRIVLSDRVILNGDLYLPETVCKLPTIIMRTPYGKHNINAFFDPIDIVRNGFALLVQNVRGRYESTGKFLPFENEKSDGDATIQWIVNQPWSNHNIYSLGVSYEGFTSIMLGMNKYTKGVAPIMSSSNIHRDWFFENGCVKQGFVQSWSHSFAFTDNGELLSSQQIDIVQKLANDIKKLYYGHLYDFPVHSILNYYKSWINSNDDEYWDKISLATSGSINSALYFVTGWYDIFCEGTINQFKTEAQRDKARPISLVIGPWSHIDIFNSVVGDIDFGVYSLEKYSSFDIIRWFKKIENREIIQSTIKIYIMGLNKWYHFSSFPVSEPVELLLVKEGDNRTMCSDLNDLSVDTDFFTFTSNNLVPTCGGRCIDAIPEGLGGPRIQNEVEKRKDVLVYTSKALTKELTILGEVFFTISCISSLSKMDYMIKLCDVDDEGNAINILDSCLRITDKADIKRTHTLSLGNVGHCFLPGHMIRCEIASSNFPRINVQDFLIEKNADNSIYLNGDTKIILPVVNL